MTPTFQWPILKHYDQNHLLRLAMPIGGIGTGSVSLGGRGNLQDWEIVNRPAKGFTPKNAFFALYAKTKDNSPVLRCLEGQISPTQFENAQGCEVPNHGLPRFRGCSFDAAYPFGAVNLSDPDVPLKVRLEAFNPLVPAEPDDSGIPVAVLRYVLTNPTGQPVDATVAGSLQNFIGADGSDPIVDGVGRFTYDHKIKTNTNEFRRGFTQAGHDRPGQAIQGIFMASNGVDPAAEAFGTIALSTLAKEGVTYRTNWANLSWGDSLLDFWDDLSQDGRLDERDPDGVDGPTASLAVSLSVPAGASRVVTFLLTWRFPNRQTWTPVKEEAAVDCADPSCDCHTGSHNNVGNYYATLYQDAWDVAVKIAPRLESLEIQTLEFGRAFLDSSIPDVVKEAALFNLSTLRTQTCFRIRDGHFLAWEGSNNLAGCCHGSCTHVWNYEQATAFLFGNLSRSMREVEFKYATSPQGRMSFRANLPLTQATDWGVAAADGQMGCLMKLYRDWQLSHNDAMLRELWPAARKAVEFCWIPGGWDADQDGVMEGCQHNTMDVEYYGPNPQMGGWYLGALRATEEMACYLGEIDFAHTCRALFERGRDWMDAHLFNGDYYEHEVRPPKDGAAIAQGLRLNMGVKNLAEPELQLGAGCLIDQLVGQTMAHVAGLGYLLNPHHVRYTLHSLMEYNFKTNFSGHFNHLRSFVLNDESAMLMATYPKGRRPTRPFPYYNEVMTGFEYSTAAHMIYEGLVDEGLTMIRAIRARYDGLKRSPFDEAECGHHYGRAMASWGVFLAMSGFQYSAVNGSLTFKAMSTPGQVFWSNGSAWGICRQTPRDGQIEVELEVLHGSLPLQIFILQGLGSAHLGEIRTIQANQSLKLVVEA